MRATTSLDQDELSLSNCLRARGNRGGKLSFHLLFIAPQVEGHGFGADGFGVPVEEQGIAAFPVPGPGDAAAVVDVLAVRKRQMCTHKNVTADDFPAAGALDDGTPGGGFVVGQIDRPRRPLEHG